MSSAFSMGKLFTTLKEVQESNIWVILVIIPKSKFVKSIVSNTVQLLNILFAFKGTNEILS